MTSVAVLDAIVLDGTGGLPSRRGSVLLDGAEIALVGEPDDIRAAAPSGTRIVDAQGATLLPGLIDAHVHLAWGDDAIEGWAAVEADRGLLDLYAAGAAQGALAAGVTTVRDCGAPGLTALRLRDAVARGLLQGPRVLAAGPCITTTAGHGACLGVPADTADELIRRIRELRGHAVDFVKIMATGGSMDPHTNRRRAQYDAEQLRAAVADARRLGLPVVAHCNATEGIRHAVEAGAGTIAHCNWLGEHEGTIDYDPRIADLMVAQRTVIDLNVAATLAPYRDGDGHAQRWPAGEGPANRWELHADLRKRGARILLSSDEFGPRVRTFPALLALFAEQTGAPVAEVVHRATGVPAEALGIADQVGTIQPGLAADLVLLDGDLTTDATALTRPAALWRAGRRIQP